MAGTEISEIRLIKMIAREERVEETLDDVDEDHIPDEQQATLEMDWDEEEAAANSGEDETKEGETKNLLIGRTLLLLAIAVAFKGADAVRRFR